MKTEVGDAKDAGAPNRHDALRHIGAVSIATAHEINNYLAIAAGNLDIACKRIDDPAVTALLKRARDAIDMLTAASGQFAALAGSDPDENPASIRPAPAIHDFAERLRRLKGNDVRIEAAAPASLWRLPLERRELEAALFVLCKNAIEAMPEGGVLSISAGNVAAQDRSSDGRQRPPPSGEHVAIVVRDTGSGMSPEILQHAGTPFFTTKSPHSHSGLGLASLGALLESRGGSVDIVSAPGTGTMATIRVPRVAEAP